MAFRHKGDPNDIKISYMIYDDEVYLWKYCFDPNPKYEVTSQPNHS